MELTATIVTLWLAAQTSAPVDDPPATLPRLTAIELASQAVRLPDDEPGVFRDVTLAEVLAAAPRDRSRRTAIVYCYWSLWRTFADRAVTLDHLAQLQRLEGIAQESERTLLAAETAAAEARRQETELAVHDAQFELCGLIGWSTDTPLPRPSDAPHVGTYHTYYDSIYAKRTPTQRVLTIHQTLPIYHAAVAAHAAAWQAADDLVVAQERGFQEGTVDIEALLSAWRARARQRQELCRVAWEYNTLIAEYAVPLAGEQMEVAKVVAMLIRFPESQPTGDVGVEDDAGDDVLPTRYQADAPEQNGATDDGAPQSPAEETTEVPLEGPQEGLPFEGLPSDNEGVPPTSPPDGSSVIDPFPTGQRYNRRGRRHLAAKPIVANVSARYYAPGAPSAAGTIDTLYRRTYIPEDAGAPISLKECLAGAGNRLSTAVLSAYVDAWRAAACFQAEADAGAQLQALRPAVIAQRNEPQGAAGMLELRAAELGSRARLLEAEGFLWQRALGLATLARPGKPVERVLPSEAPLWAAAESGAASKVVESCAVSLVAADAARCEAMTEYAAQRIRIGLVLGAIRRQNEETQALAGLCVRSANEVGHTVVASLPPTSSVDAICEALRAASPPPPSVESSRDDTRRR